MTGIGLAGALSFYSGSLFAACMGVVWFVAPPPEDIKQVVLGAGAVGLVAVVGCSFLFAMIMR